MPVFWLDKETPFPSVDYADESGLLAIGKDLKTTTLIDAYTKGIFPWYSEDEPIMWWSPDPRCVLFPNEVYISKSMKKILRDNIYKITFDRAFTKVIRHCKTVKRKDENGTWISEEIVDAYTRLHKIGLAHSVEVWYENVLVGGLYGVCLGKMFFGESMFSQKSNASKTAFIALAKKLYEQGFQLIDCQVYNPHLESMGAKMIHRSDFSVYLKDGLKYANLAYNWSENDAFKIEETKTLI